MLSSPSRDASHHCPMPEVCQAIACLCISDKSATKTRIFSLLLTLFSVSLTPPLPKAQGDTMIKPLNPLFFLSLLSAYRGVGSAANLNIAAGSRMALGDAKIDLGCSDLRLQGQLSLQHGAISQVRDLGNTGVLNGGQAILEVTGNWRNNGTVRQFQFLQSGNHHRQRQAGQLRGRRHATGRQSPDPRRTAGESFGDPQHDARFARFSRPGADRHPDHRIRRCAG